MNHFEIREKILLRIHPEAKLFHLIEFMHDIN